MGITEEESELRLLCDAAHFFDQDKSDLWMESRQRQLSMERPSDLIEAGRGHEVRNVLNFMLNKLEG